MLYFYKTAKILIFVLLFLSGWFVIAYIFGSLLQPMFFISLLTLGFSYWLYNFVNKKLYIEKKKKIIKKLEIYPTLKTHPSSYAFITDSNFNESLIMKLMSAKERDWDKFIDNYENEIQKKEIDRETEFRLCVRDLQNNAFISQVEQEVDSLSPKHFPKLIEWQKINRKGLVQQILLDKQNRPKDSIGMIMAAYESDL